MKITKLELHGVSFGPLEKPFWNSIKKTTSSGGGRLEIHTDEGIVGMSPCGAGGGRKATILGSISQKLIGEDPIRIGYLWDKMYMGRTRKPVAKGDYFGAVGAVDNALWDLTGKALGQPVWKLAGGVQDRVFAYAAGGYYEEGKEKEDLAAELKSYVDTGFKAVKMKVGWPGVTLREDAERVRAAREAIGPDIELMIAAMASTHHLKMAPHGNPNIGATCVAAVENGLITENYPTAFKNRLMGPVDFRSDGYIYMSDAPGLGIEWDEDLLREHKV